MIQKLFSQEKPRERCLIHGPESLSLRECLAVILGSGPKGVGCMGLASRLLQDEEGSPLSEETFFRIVHGDFRNRLASEPGIGPAGQARLLVTFEIARRYWLFERKNNEAKLANTHNEITLQRLRKKIPDSFVILLERI